MSAPDQLFTPLQWNLAFILRIYFYFILFLFFLAFAYYF